MDKRRLTAAAACGLSAGSAALDKAGAHAFARALPFKRSGSGFQAE